MSGSRYRGVWVVPLTVVFVVTTPALSWAGTGILTEAVNTYHTCLSNFPDLQNNFGNVNGFWVNMTWHGGFTFINNWQDQNVWDRDFADSDRNVEGDDLVSFDMPGEAYTMYSGHGTCHQSTGQHCTSSSQCTSPQYPQTSPGFCVAGPNRSAATCEYNISPNIVTCSSNDAFGHMIDYENGIMALGESPTSGAWAGVGTNGGNNFAIIDISCPVSPALEGYQMWNIFAGVHNVATIMPMDNQSDTEDSASRGQQYAFFYMANHNAAAGASWASSINNVPASEGGSSSCDGKGGGHGIIGCGSQIVLSVAQSQTQTQWFNFTQTFNDVQNDATDAVGGSNMQWYYVCNYDCFTYPPVLW